jgi:hypothetical protein
MAQTHRAARHNQLNRNAGLGTRRSIQMTFGIRYEPDKENGDFTWEREWRIKTGELALDPEVTTVVVPNRRWATHITNEFVARKQQMSRAMFRRLGPFPHFEFPFNLIALEDLGFNFDVIDPKI